MSSVLTNMCSICLRNETILLEEYDDEVMCAGWNPQLAALVQSCTLISKQVTLLARWTHEDVDTFLQKIYACQC